MHVLWIMLAKAMGIKYFNVETWMLFAPHIKISGHAPGQWTNTFALLPAGKVIEKPFTCNCCIESKTLETTSKTAVLRRPFTRELHHKIVQS